MINRTTLVMASITLSMLCLVFWERSSKGQDSSQQIAPVQASSNPRNMPLGGECSVILRGDAVGASGNHGIVDLSSLVTVKGRLEAGGDHWIVLKSDDGKREWFPVDAVAAVVADK